MRALLGILICLCAQQALADTRYVSDNIFTFIHNGPGTQFRILGSVKAGEPLYSLESDKSVVEIESPATGRLRIGAKAGEVYQVGAVLGEIL